MRKNSQTKKYLLILTLIIFLSGCNLPWDQQGGLSNEEQLQTQVAGTISAIQPDDDPQITQEEPPSPEENTPIPTQTETITPTITMTATMTMTATPETPMVGVSVDTNCRSGPGTIYDYIGALLVGEQAEVVGRSDDGEYWIIKNPDREGECWLWAQYAEVMGQTAELPLYTQPPTPTPTFDWAGTWTLSVSSTTGPPIISYTLTIDVDGKNLDGYADLGGGASLTISGTISDDYLTVSGNWIGPTNNGTFEFFALGVNQFQGNYADDVDIYAWCGGRGGAGVPSPCYKN